MRGFCRDCILFVIGGMMYFFIEILFRGYSHWTMALIGGICFLLIGGINEYIPWEMHIWVQMMIGAVIITTVELMAGIILNIWLGLNIWDYSGILGNILGQVCLPFSIAWYFLSLIGIVLDDYLRYLLFGEDRPHYIWR